MGKIKKISMENGLDRDILVYKPGSDDEIQTTLKAYRTIYDHITGVKQSISKEFFIDYDIGFAQLDQLNIKVGQLLKQFNVASQNCSVVIMHEDEDQETYNSYEQFSTYNISNIHPITIINIKYNFSILLPSTSEINNYTLIVSIVPGVIPPMSLRKNYRRLRYAGPTIKTEIEYSDYVVARTFIENISDWIKSIEIHEEISHFQKFISKRSDYVASFIRNGSLLLLVTIILINNKKIIPSYSTDLNILFSIIFLISFILFFTYRIVNHFCDYLKFNLDIPEKRSILNINEGDKKLIQKIDKNNKKQISKNIWSFLCTLITTLISSIIIKIIFNL